MKSFTIKTKKRKIRIGPGQPTFIVAEMSGNHNHNFKKALKIIDATAEAGADAIKLQTYTPDTLTIDLDNKYFQIKVNKAWKGQTLYKLYKKAYTPWEWQPKLKKHAESKGLLFFSTPFDETAVNFLEKINVQLYKIASFEIIDTPLLKKIGKTKKPVIISRGMASINEIKLAIKTLKKHGCPQIVLLHCVSSYPAQPKEMNLKTIPDIQKRFKVISGLSDHTLGIGVAIASIPLGASVIEKHIILRRADGGPDSEFSLEPWEFKQLVKSVREVEVALGKPQYKAGEKESENIIFRRSLFITKDVKKGEKLTKDNVRSIRPGYGLPPRYLNDILNKKVNRSLKKGTPLAWKCIIKKK